MEQFDLEAYLSRGVETIVKGILKATVRNPRASIYMAQYAATSKKARKARQQAEEQGEHIPPFLIASITDQCNLHCKGCYAWANDACHDADHETCGGSCHEAEKAPDGMLTSGQWGGIFKEAQELGIGFILLAGGEPFTRPDILREAATYKKILFPVFTNGTMVNKEYMKLFSANPNLVPILSIEGSQEATDQRRGPGVYAKLRETMAAFQKAGILFGASVTVTKDNAEEVLSDAFTEDLTACGCRAVIYVEYVPIDHITASLAPDDATRAYIEARLNILRSRDPQLLLIAFPGDEKSSGGCLAAGRGFFHINAAGGAEPCPFSPYSDTSLLHTGLREALRSPLFSSLRTGEILMEDHAGGCVLFQQEEQVRKLLGEAGA